MTGNSPAISDKTDVSTGATKGKSETVKKSKKQEAVASNKQVVSGKKSASVKVVASPEKILKDKIKRRKKIF